MIRSINVHNVESIRVAFDAQGWQVFTFIDSDKVPFELTAFTHDPIAIEGAEMLALMAAGDAAQEEGSLVPLLQASIEAAKAKKEAAHG